MRRRVRTCWTAIDEETDRLTLMVSNLLDLSRIEGGALRPQKDWYDIDELIVDVRARLAPRTRSHPLTITVEPDLPLLRFDYVQIAQVLVNLIENAVKYTPDGTPIVVAAHQIPGAIEISVHDDGPGIPPEHQLRLFDKFYRAYAATAAPGAGHWSGHQQRIGRSPRGTHLGRERARERNDVSLHLAAASAVARSVSPSRDRGGPIREGAGGMSGERVLVVDDEPQIRRALNSALTAHGYAVAVAEDGATALETIASWAPDAVVLDLVMPGVDGFDVLRETRTWSPVPIIVLSARGGEADKVAALDQGADDYLTKPFGMAELLARLRVMLRRERVGAPDQLTAGDVTIDLQSTPRLSRWARGASHTDRVRPAAGAGE